MTRLLIAAGLLAAALPALAQTSAAPTATTPALYQVTDVETKLNVRAEPSTEAAIIGALAPDARDVEVVGVDASGDWARVNIGEGAGWVSRAFLSSQGDLWAANSLPDSLRCFGTEPFWDLRHTGDTLVQGSPGAEDRPLAIDSVTGAAGSGSRVVIARDKTGTVTLGIAPEHCSDGMSDRAFGLGAEVNEAGSPALIGCCSVAPRN